MVHIREHGEVKQMKMKNVIFSIFLSMVLATCSFAGGFTTLSLDNSAKPLQQWKTSEIPLSIESIMIGSTQFRTIAGNATRQAVAGIVKSKTYVKQVNLSQDQYDITLTVKRLQSTFQPKSIEYVIQLYSDYGEPMLQDGANIITVQNPNFAFMDTDSIGTKLKGVTLKEKPASAKVWLKRYINNAGKVFVVK